MSRLQGSGSRVDQVVGGADSFFLKRLQLPISAA